MNEPSDNRPCSIMRKADKRWFCGWDSNGMPVWSHNESLARQFKNKLHATTQAYLFISLESAELVKKERKQS